MTLNYKFIICLKKPFTLKLNIQTLWRCVRSNLRCNILLESLLINTFQSFLKRDWNLWNHMNTKSTVRSTWHVYFKIAPPPLFFFMEILICHWPMWKYLSHYLSSNVILFVIIVIWNYYVVLCSIFAVRHSLACSRRSHPIPGIAINMICALYCMPVS